MGFSGAAIFDLVLDGQALHGRTLRHLLSMELKESMDELDALTVRLAVPEQAREVLRFTRPGAGFVVRLGYDGGAMREVHGDIMDVGHSRSASGWEVTLTGVDAMHRLKKTRSTRVWTGNHAEVIQGIAQECGLVPKLEGVSSTGSLRLQLNEEAAGTLSRIAKENNYFVRVEGGKILRFGRRGLPYMSAPVVLKWGTDILEISVNYSLEDLVTEVKTRGQDYVQDLWQEGIATVGNLRRLSGGLAGPELARRAFGEVKLCLDNAAQSQISQLQERAEGEMQERAEKFLNGSCKCVGMPWATSGSTLIITGAGWPLSSKYLISETTHTFDPGSGYTTAITFSSDSLPPGESQWWGGL